MTWHFQIVVIIASLRECNIEYGVDFFIHETFQLTAEFNQHKYNTLPSELLTVTGQNWWSTTKSFQTVGKWIVFSWCLCFHNGLYIKKTFGNEFQCLFKQTEMKMIYICRFTGFFISHCYIAESKQNYSNCSRAPRLKYTAPYPFCLPARGPLNLRAYMSCA